MVFFSVFGKVIIGGVFRRVVVRGFYFYLWVFFRSRVFKVGNYRETFLRWVIFRGIF